MKTALLTESEFTGKVPSNHPNMRTEMAWQATLQSDHFNIHSYKQVSGYDVVFIIFPKALVKLNRIGIEMTYPNSPRDEHNIKIYNEPVVETLKKNNGKVCYIQEGPSNFFNDYDLVTQFHFYNQLAECDILFAHNEHDTHFYKGLFPRTKVCVIPSLMLTPLPLPMPQKEDKCIIGGNFARWYGGFQSYITATDFNCPIFVPASHCKRRDEEQVPGLTHLPWVMWDEWMKQLATFKYAVNLMPTVAAGTFSMNCAFYGIPCIGNQHVDTQLTLFPDLSVDVNDIHSARFLAIRLKSDLDFYEEIGHHARKTLLQSHHNNPVKWLAYMEDALNG
jgi:hypothetical protein